MIGAQYRYSTDGILISVIMIKIFNYCFTHLYNEWCLKSRHNVPRVLDTLPNNHHINLNFKLAIGSASIEPQSLTHTAVA